MKASGMNGLLSAGAVEKAVRSVQRKVVDTPAVGGSPNRVMRLRNRHHTIARMVAADVPRERICQQMGLTWNTLDLLIEQTPAFQELVSKYRGMPPLPEAVGYLDVLERAMIAAELESADRVLEDPEKLSISELHKVSRDGADSLGYSKHSVNLNVNITLAERLESSRRRRNQMPPPAGAGDGGGALSAVPNPRSAPPLLNLKAEPPGPTSHPPVLGHPDRPTAQPPSEGAMSLQEVLVMHNKAALEARRNTGRAEPPTEKITRRL